MALLLRTWKLPAAVCLAGLALALCASGAAAAPRFAAPGGTAPASSACEITAPCSLFNAASENAPGTALKAGDEVVVEEGNYNDADLGAARTVVLKPGTSVHGAAGQAVPVLGVSTEPSTNAALIVQAGTVLSRFEVFGLVPRSVLEVRGGIVEGVVARSSGGGTTCTQVGGLIRNSVCLATGLSGTAIGAQLSLASVPGRTFATKLRNVTAISTGSNGFALQYRLFEAGSVTIDAVDLIAKGSAGDIFAGGFSVGNHDPGTGANVAVSLRNSDYEKVEARNDAAGSTATVSPAGVGTNITAAPLLAADRYHELPGSPTIDQGVADDESGPTDIGGDPRTIRLTDIGADEFVPPATTTAVSCSPESFTVGEGPAACVATVSGANTASPVGTIAFASTVKEGTFSAGGSCNLAPAGDGKASCQVFYAPTVAGSHEITASYEGDPGDGQSEGKASLTIAPRPREEPHEEPHEKPHEQPHEEPHPAPATRLTKKPRARSSNRLARFDFASDQANSTFQCKLDKGKFKPCSSPFRTKVKPGRHTFQVRAVNSAGLADPTPASYRWTVARPRHR